MDDFPQGQRLGLSLSGGGIRAAVFHLGVLHSLAKQRQLEQVSQISTVSGGSLIVGAIFSHSDMHWPSSERFLNEIYPELRAKLTSRDLFSFKALGQRGVVRENLRILFHRAEILPKLLASQWGVRGTTKDLPDTPEWHINTTCYETGKNWRFSKKMMGDWVFGRHFSPEVPIATAIAASAAVPYAIGALRLKLSAHGWWSTDPVTKKPLQKLAPRRPFVRLWDGGAYENMGLEALYKPAEGLLGCDFLICSDASGPLVDPKPFPFSDLLQGKLSSPRLFDIASDQIRALRSRMLMGSILRGEIRGVLVKMGTSMRQFGIPDEKLSGLLTDEQAGLSLNYPTNLTQVTADDFDMISRHGQEVCQATLDAYKR
jgi:NTE family protein